MGNGANTERCTVKFTPLPFSRPVDKVLFDDLLREAKGEFEKSAPKFHYLWSFLFSEALKDKRNIPKQNLTGQLPETVWMQFSRISALLHRRIKTEIDPELVPLSPMTVRSKKTLQLDADLVAVDDETHHIEHEISAQEAEVFEFYLLKVPRSRAGIEFATKEKIIPLVDRILEKASPKGIAKKRKTVEAVLYHSLVCLAARENKPGKLQAMDHVPAMQKVGRSTKSSNKNASRDYITRLVSNLE